MTSINFMIYEQRNDGHVYDVDYPKYMLFTDFKGVIEARNWVEENKNIEIKNYDYYYSAPFSLKIILVKNKDNVITKFIGLGPWKQSHLNDLLKSTTRNKFPIPYIEEVIFPKGMIRDSSAPLINRTPDITLGKFNVKTDIYKENFTLKNVKGEIKNLEFVLISNHDNPHDILIRTLTQAYCELIKEGYTYDVRDGDTLTIQEMNIIPV